MVNLMADVGIEYGLDNFPSDDNYVGRRVSIAGNVWIYTSDAGWVVDPTGDSIPPPKQKKAFKQRAIEVTRYIAGVLLLMFAVVDMVAIVIPAVIIGGLSFVLLALCYALILCVCGMAVIGLRLINSDLKFPQYRPFKLKLEVARKENEQDVKN